MALESIIHRKRPTWWQQLSQTPCLTTAKTLYALRQRMIASTTEPESFLGITVVCISDTHNMVLNLPPGDLLVHAGDLTQTGTAAEIQAQLDWLNAQPHTHKILIAGNHDIILDSQKSKEFGIPDSHRESLQWGSLIYLQRTSRTLSFENGAVLTVFGQPDTRKHGNWAFQYDRGIDAFTGQIPDVVDIVVTHSPPRYHLDIAGWGDENLLRCLWRTKPKLHIFGHMHEGYGRDELVYDAFEKHYESVYAGRAAWLALCRMLWLLFELYLSFWSNQQIPSTILVNASMVGGHLDELRHHPIVVRL